MEGTWNELYLHTHRTGYNPYKYSSLDGCFRSELIIILIDRASEKKSEEDRDGESGSGWNGIRDCIIIEISWLKNHIHFAIECPHFSIVIKQHDSRVDEEQKQNEKQLQRIESVSLSIQRMKNEQKKHTW